MAKNEIEGDSKKPKRKVVNIDLNKFIEKIELMEWRLDEKGNLCYRPTKGDEGWKVLESGKKK